MAFSSSQKLNEWHEMQEGCDEKDQKADENENDDDDGNRIDGQVYIMMQPGVSRRWIPIHWKLDPRLGAKVST